MRVRVFCSEDPGVRYPRGVGGTKPVPCQTSLGLPFCFTPPDQHAPRGVQPGCRENPRFEAPGCAWADAGGEGGGVRLGREYSQIMVTYLLQNTHAGD